MDLSLIFNDPAHQQLASMRGMGMQDYVSSMDPRALEANLANLSRGPAVYNTQRNVDTSMGVGANSGRHASITTPDSPITAGMLYSPNQPQFTPQGGMSPGALANPDSLSSQSAPGSLQAPLLDVMPNTGIMSQPNTAPTMQPNNVPTMQPNSGVLTSGGVGATQGALTSGGAAPVAPRPNSGSSSGVRQSPTNNTANARKSGMPDMRIGRMEQLGRMGSAMLGSAGDGLLASMSAGGDAMYAVNDENREAQMSEYENSERLRLEEAQRRAAASARSGSGGGGSGGGSGNASMLSSAAAIKLRDVDTALQGLDDYDGVVGMGYWFNVGWDKITDGQRQTIRQKIARVKVDATLANTALTKGAISDSEMKIFMSDQPSWTDGENAWRQWLSEYRGALLTMNANLASGATPYLNQVAPSGQPTGPAPAPTNSTTTDFSAADALVFGG